MSYPSHGPGLAGHSAKETRFAVTYERPHQALAMKVPAALYTRSARVYRGLRKSSPTRFTSVPGSAEQARERRLDE
jgi:hypothetical protein